MFGLAGLLLKFPFLGRMGSFFTSGKFLAFLAAIIVGSYIITQGISFIGNYVDREVKSKVELTLSKQEVEQLRVQVKTLENNQKIVDHVVKETRVVQQQQQVKAEKIEDKINEQVQKGDDRNSGSIIASVIDSL